MTKDTVKETPTHKKLQAIKQAQSPIGNKVDKQILRVSYLVVKNSI